MAFAPRARRILFLAIGVTVLSALYLWNNRWVDPATQGFDSVIGHDSTQDAAPAGYQPDETYFWRTVTVNHPVQGFAPLPTSEPTRFPKVQATFPAESNDARITRQKRQRAIKDTFVRSWNAYKQHAWMADELTPVGGGARNPFGGWAATLVDALDTLWIMDLNTEFDLAVDAVGQIDFTKTDLEEVNIFETTIRYLGGFLAAFDLSGDTRLLRKASEVGELIYKAFDTPNHMPVMRWSLHAAAKGDKQLAGSGTLVAEIGSLCMELTRLSQITRDPKWFDAANRISEHFAAQQNMTELPGLWPLVVDAEKAQFHSGSTFTLGAMADSLYEYLPKMAALTGGQLPLYQTMYESAMDVAPKYNFFRPMTPKNEDILISGQVHTDRMGEDKLPKRNFDGQHLVCFLGGVLAIGSKLFSRSQDLELARKLTDGCIFTYSAFPHGVMPETFHMAHCEKSTECAWDEEAWKTQVVQANPAKDESKTKDADAIIRDEALPPGFTRIPDRRYILRPEALESVFVLYRVTGEQKLADSAWNMFSSIEAATRTELANSAVWDITRPGQDPPRSDSMESFWMGETLKYAYLTFSEPALISLDEWVFNTEAHPFRRP